MAGDKMTSVEFLENVACGGFIDYDGFGYYMTEEGMTKEVVIPSDVARGEFKSEYPFIMWFNK